MKKYLLLAAGLFVLYSCQVTPERTSLPFFGQHDIDAATGDTTLHTIPDFSFIDQDSQVITNATFEGMAYIGDFFFTSCPTICPKVKKQMLRLYDKYEHEDRLSMLSHTIDAKHDTVPVLKEFAEALGVSTPRWHFVWGTKDAVYGITEDYMSVAIEDPEAPGGFDHSGWLLLIDKDRHIRSFCDGTDPEKVDRFMEDIDLLLSQM